MTLNMRLSPRKPSRLAGAALGVAAFAALVTLYALVLTRTRAVDAASGFAAFLSGLALAVLAIALALIAMAVVWRTGKTGGARSFFAVVIAAAVLGGPAYAAATGLFAPRMTDAATDLADPPRFERTARLRSSADLPAPGPSVAPDQAAAQRAGYPDLAPLRLALPPDEVSNLAIGLVEERGWRIVGRTSFPRAGPPTGRIEAVARTFALGLEEDVSIRVRPDGEGSRVDMRSASRIGPADFGSNAQRIRSFLADLASAANAAP